MWQASDSNHCANSARNGSENQRIATGRLLHALSKADQKSGSDPGDSFNDRKIELVAPTLIQWD